MTPATLAGAGSEAAAPGLRCPPACPARGPAWPIAAVLGLSSRSRSGRSASPGRTSLFIDELTYAEVADESRTARCPSQFGEPFFLHPTGLVRRRTGS